MYEAFACDAVVIDDGDEGLLRYSLLRFRGQRLVRVRLWKDILKIRGGRRSIRQIRAATPAEVAEYKLPVGALRLPSRYFDRGYARSERYLGAAAVGLAVATLAAAAATARPLYIEVGDVTRAPLGWVEFCASRFAECAAVPSAPRDVVLTPKALEDLVSVNRYVNEAVTPMTDLEHWGTIEKWSYPDDGYGDCEDYVLLKRRMLIQATLPCVWKGVTQALGDQAAIFLSRPRCFSIAAMRSRA